MYRSEADAVGVLGYESSAMIAAISFHELAIECEPE
jgi:hypothetical protein